MRRILCAHLPQWPLQRLLRGAPRLRSEPTAIIGLRGRIKQMVLVCPRAKKAGVKPGMPLAEAQAIEPRLSIHDEDPAADRKTLAQLAVWAERFSPLVALEEGDVPSCLLLDVTGCAACFGGEAKLLAEAWDGFAKQGWRARLALANTVGAAWALTHAGEEEAPPVLVPAGEAWPKLAPLSTAVLRLPDLALPTLKELGIDQIGQLAELPREELPSRFGAEVLRRLDQAQGRVPEPIVPHRPLPEIIVGCEFEHPTGSQAALLHVFGSLLREAETELRRRCRGARRIEGLLKTEDGQKRFELELLRPCGDAARLEAMLRVKLEQVRLLGPALGVSLRVAAEEQIAEEQSELFDGGAALRARGWSALAEGLSVRFGKNAVIVARLVADPQPELAYRTEPALAAKAAQSVQLDIKILRHRPLRLWPEPRAIEVLALTPPGAPRALRSGALEQQVVSSWGPERIETGWWRGRDVHRDYFMVETETGSRLWIFRRLDDGRWFWHGCFD